MSMLHHLLLIVGGAGVFGATLTGDAPFVVSDDVGQPVMMALRDVSMDLYKVLGYRTIFVPYADWANNPVQTKDLPVTIFAADATNANITKKVPAECQAALKEGAEAHCVCMGEQDASALYLVGNGMRGLIYALYEFSHTVLGVDPVYRFSGVEAPYQGKVVVSDTLCIVNHPPKFTYRAMFPNDEDLLGWFRRDPAGEMEFDANLLDEYLETVLRLKGNMMLVGTNPYPDERSYQLVARRGVVISHHHYNILGYNALRFREYPLLSSLYDWAAHPDLVAHVWNASLHALKRTAPDSEVVWSIGLRGLGDHSYCQKGQSAEYCAGQINTAMANQTSFMAPGDHAVTYMWDEALSYLLKGLLKVPPGVRIVFSDGGSGIIGGLDQAHLGHGLYYHVMMQSGSSNSLTEMVPPSRIFDQIGKFIKAAKETFYFVINTSDLRPVTLGIQAVMSMVWDPSRHAGDPVAAQTAFLTKACARYFKGISSSDCAMLYAQYYNVSAAGPHDQFFGWNMGIGATAARQLQTGNHSIYPSTVASAQKFVEDSKPVVDGMGQVYSKALAMAKDITDGTGYFRSHLVVESSILYHAAVALSSVSQSVIAYSKGDKKSAVALADAAMAAFDTMFADQRTAEMFGSGWRGVYSADRLPYADFQDRRREVVIYHSFLHSTPPLPSVATATTFYNFEDYQCATPAGLSETVMPNTRSRCNAKLFPEWVERSNYPFMYPHEDNIQDFVYFACANGTCEVSPTGGRFATQAHITVGSVAQQGQSHLVVTKDGTLPSPSGPKVASGTVLTITSSTTFKAAVLRTDGTLGKVRVATFTQV